MSNWEILGIEPTYDTRAIKRAYAAQSKLHHPETDPEGFQALYGAYQWALERAKTRQPQALTKNPVKINPGVCMPGSRQYRGRHIKRAAREGREPGEFLARQAAFRIYNQLVGLYPDRLQKSEWESLLRFTDAPNLHGQAHQTRCPRRPGTGGAAFGTTDWNRCHKALPGGMGRMHPLVRLLESQRDSEQIQKQLMQEEFLARQAAFRLYNQLVGLGGCLFQALLKREVERTRIHFCAGTSKISAGILRPSGVFRNQPSRPSAGVPCVSLQTVPF